MRVCEAFSSPASRFAPPNFRSVAPKAKREESSAYALTTTGGMKSGMKSMIGASA